MFLHKNLYFFNQFLSNSSPTYRGTHQLEIAVGVFFDIMINIGDI